MLLLLGNMRSTASIEFGAHQVVLDRDNAARRTLPPQPRLALIMTVYEAKDLALQNRRRRAARAGGGVRSLARGLRRLPAAHRRGAV